MCVLLLVLIPLTQHFDCSKLQAGRRNLSPGPFVLLGKRDVWRLGQCGMPYTFAWLQALSKLGMDNAAIQKIITEVDKDGNGEIDYNEFCLMVSDLLGC
jgi:hypothetical protein